MTSLTAQQQTPALHTADGSIDDYGEKALTCCCGFGIIYCLPFLCKKEGLGEILLIIYDYMNNRFFS